MFTLYFVGDSSDMLENVLVRPPGGLTTPHQSPATIPHQSDQPAAAIPDLPGQPPTSLPDLPDESLTSLPDQPDESSAVTSNQPYQLQAVSSDQPDQPPPATSNQPDLATVISGQSEREKCRRAYLVTNAHQVDVCYSVPESDSHPMPEAVTLDLLQVQELVTSKLLQEQVCSSQLQELVHPQPTQEAASSLAEPVFSQPLPELASLQPIQGPLNPHSPGKAASLQHVDICAQAMMLALAANAVSDQENFASYMIDSSDSSNAFAGIDSGVDSCDDLGFLSALQLPLCTKTSVAPTHVSNNVSSNASTISTSSGEQDDVYSSAIKDTSNIDNSFTANPESLPCWMPKAASTDLSKNPQVPYIELCAASLLSAPAGRLLLTDIYDWVTTNFPYFTTALCAWRNSIRHALCVNECFIKAAKAPSGHGFYWAIHPACEPDFRRGDFNRRQARKRVLQALRDMEGDNRPLKKNARPTPKKPASLKPSSPPQQKSAPEGHTQPRVSPENTIAFSPTTHSQTASLQSSPGLSSIDVSGYQTQSFYNHTTTSSPTQQPCQPCGPYSSTPVRGYQHHPYPGQPQTYSPAAYFTTHCTNQPYDASSSYGYSDSGYNTSLYMSPTGYNDSYINRNVHMSGTVYQSNNNINNIHTSGPSYQDHKHYGYQNTYSQDGQYSQNSGYNTQDSGYVSTQWSSPDNGYNSNSGNNGYYNISPCRTSLAM